MEEISKHVDPGKGIDHGTNITARRAAIQHRLENRKVDLPTRRRGDGGEGTQTVGRPGPRPTQI